MARLLVFGASGQLGDALLPRLLAAGHAVEAVSRRPRRDAPGLRWRPGDLAGTPPPPGLDAVISLGPLDAFSHWAARHPGAAPRWLAFGSTSADAKRHSSDPDERAVALALREAEARLAAAAGQGGARACVLRPTLVYGRGRDRSLSTMAAFARRWGWLPVPRTATGLRQPVHLDDLADAALAGLVLPLQGAPALRAFDLPGGEALAFDAMAARLLAILPGRPRLLRVPAAPLRAAAALAALAGRPRHGGALARLARDQVFDAAPATAALGYAPRPFAPVAADFPARVPAASGEGHAPA